MTGGARREPFAPCQGSYSEIMVISVSRPILLHLPPAPDAVSDADLVARAVAGDRWAREMLYRRHAAYLLGMAARLLASRGDAEEIVQDTFVVGFDRLGALRDPAAVRGWLAQIAVNMVRRRMRRARVLRFVGLDRDSARQGGGGAGAGGGWGARGGDATLAALAAPGLDAEGRGELALFDRVLARMRAELRIAWVLRRVDGLELVEV